jgi:hypothetical protein
MFKISQNSYVNDLGEYGKHRGKFFGAFGISDVSPTWKINAMPVIKIF